jgi:hypothetical protein
MNLFNLDNELNPLIVSNKIKRFVSSGLKDGTLNLYSAYSLNLEAIRIKRLGYHQSAWNYHLPISGIIALYMHYLCSLAFEDSTVSEIVMTWLKEDMILLKENRRHYITDILKKNIEPIPSDKWLEKLSSVRLNYDSLSDDDGPYHNEEFPYHYASPEGALLKKKEREKFQKRIVSPLVEDIIVSINLSKWC